MKCKLFVGLLSLLLITEPALAAITFNNFNGNLSDNGGGGTYTGSYTGATLTNGLMVMCVAGGTSTDTNPAATYNGVSMTRIGNGVVQTSGTNRWLYEFYLLNPASGSHTISITQTGTGELLPIVAEYAGVLQSGQPDSSATPTTSIDPLTMSITIANANSWAVLCGNATNSGMNNSADAGAGTIWRGADALYGITGLFDSNGALSVGAHSMSINAQNPGGIQIGATDIGFQPASTSPTSNPKLMIAPSIP